MAEVLRRFEALLPQLQASARQLLGPATRPGAPAQPALIALLTGLHPAAAQQQTPRCTGLLWTDLSRMQSSLQQPPTQPVLRISLHMQPGQLCASSAGLKRGCCSADAPGNSNTAGSPGSQRAEEALKEARRVALLYWVLLDLLCAAFAGQVRIVACIAGMQHL